MEQDLLVHMGLVGVTLGEEQLGRRVAEKVPWLAHRAQGHGRRSRELDVVVAHDGELTGDIDSHAGHLLEQPEREEVVGAERRGRTAGDRQAHDALTGPATFGDVERGRLQDQDRISRAAAVLRRLSRTPQAVAHLHGAHRSAHEGDPLMSLLAEMGDGQLPALDVIDTDAAPARTGFTVDEHDRDALAPQHAEGRHVDLHGRDERSPHPLLEQQLEIVRFAAASLSLLQMNSATSLVRATSSMPLATSVKKGLAASSMR